MLRRVAACSAAVAVMCLGTPDCVYAQASTKVYRIGWLAGGNPSAGADSSVQDFRQGLRDLGYVEGKNVAIEYRSASGNAERLPELAGELVRLKVDVIVTSGGPEALAARGASRATPIVATEFGLDPVKAGLVASLGRPEANVTGLVLLSEELWPKRLGLLREISPRLSRLAVLWNPTNPGNAFCVAEINSSAAAMGLKVQPIDVRDRRALDQALTDLAKDSPDALAACWDAVTLEHAKTIADFASKRRMATVAPLREYVQSGFLLSFGTSLPAHRRRAAYYVDKILKGAKPADLPVERPTHFELVVNLATAKSLGVAHANAKRRRIVQEKAVARPRTLSMLALSLFASIAFAQSRLGELLDAGARLISEEEFKLEVVQHPLIGRTAAGGAMEIMYVTNGTIQGLGTTPQAPQLLVQATPIAGAWMIGPNGTICTTMQLHAAAGTVIALPTRCQYWYKHDGSYFISDSDSDRSAKVLRRSLRQ